MIIVLRVSVLALALLTMSLWGGFEAWASTDFETHYQQGVDYFNQKKYEDARQELVVAIEFKSDNPDALKHLALASFMVKDYPMARNLAAQYLDIAEDPAILVLFGRSSELNGDLELAASIYQKLAETSNPYRKAAQEALAKLQAGRQPQPAQQPFAPRPEGLHGAAVLAIEHDDNINTTYDNSGRPSGVEDSRAGLILSADYDVVVGDRYYMGGGGLLYGNTYKDDGQPYEIGLVRGNLHAGMVGADWNLKLAFECDYVDYGHEKEFDAERLALSFVKLMGTRYALMAQGSVANENWAQRRSDSIRYDIAVDNRLYFNEIAPNTYAHLKYQYVLNDTDEKSVDSYYYDRGTLGFRLPLAAFWDTYLSPDISYERRNYEEPVILERSDKITEYAVSLGKSWAKELSTELLYRYSDTNSNVDIYDKHQHVYGLSLTYTF